MIHKVEIQARAAGRNARYPWHLLEAEGDVLVLHGDGLSAGPAQQAAGTWARRHGLLFVTHSWLRPAQLLVVMRGA